MSRPVCKAICRGCQLPFDYKLPDSSSVSGGAFNYGSESDQGGLYYVPICPECHTDEVEDLDE